MKLKSKFHNSRRKMPKDKQSPAMKQAAAQFAPANRKKRTVKNKSKENEPDLPTTSLSASSENALHTSSNFEIGLNQSSIISANKIVLCQNSNQSKISGNNVVDLRLC